MSLNIKNLVDVVLRQTDYTEEKAIEKLKEHNNDIIAIVREYMCGSAIKKPQTIDTSNKSTNQQIYGEIRNLMDDAAKTYKAKKDLEKRREEYIAFMQAQAQAQQQAQAQAQPRASPATPMKLLWRRSSKTLSPGTNSSLGSPRRRMRNSVSAPTTSMTR